MPKKITRQQLAGTQGEAFIKERANAMGFLFSSYGQPEAGIDGLLELRDPTTSIVSGRLVAVQVKTTDDGSYTADDGTTFEYLMDPEDVAYWRGCNLPVIVVLLHLGRREAFWKSVDLGEGPGARRLRADRTKDQFDRTKRDAIAELCVAKSGFGVWFPPLKGGESGHMNLIEVMLPKHAYVGASPFKTGRQALAELLEKDPRPADDWVIRKGEFMSFHDPREGALARIVDVGSIEKVSADEVAFPDDEADEHAFIDLLRRTLGAQLDGLLVFKKDQKAFYFPADAEKIERTYHYVSLKQRTHADVVAQIRYAPHPTYPCRPRFVGFMRGCVSARPSL